jgi:hypothetical protein
MNETQRRLARLEANRPQEYPGWRRMIWDPTSGETLE